MLHEILYLPKWTETNTIVIPEDYVLSRVLAIIHIFDNVGISQESISNNYVEQ